MAGLKEAYPTANVELWCEDEHRPDLKPVIVRKVWSPVGEAHREGLPALPVNGLPLRRRSPKTGEVHRLILPRVNMEAFSLASEHFAREVGASARKRILVVLDRAGGARARRRS